MRIYIAHSFAPAISKSMYTVFRICKQHMVYIFITMSYIVTPDDYTAVASDVIQFNVGDIRVTHTIRINQDQICETYPDEAFFSDIVLINGVQPIFMIRETATIIIDDSAEQECSKISKTRHICT